MKHGTLGLACLTAALGWAAPARAASDYLLVLDGVPGEFSTVAEVASIAFTVTNSGGQATGTGAPAQAVRIPVRVPGAVEVPNLAKLAELRTADAVSGFTLTLTPGTRLGATSCAAGRHIATGHLIARGQAYDLTDITIAGCDDGRTLRLTGGVSDPNGTRGHVILMR